MKFAVFCPVVLLAVIAMLDSQLLVKAVKIASEDHSLLQDSADDVLSLAQWGGVSPMGPNDLTVGEQGDRFYLGQLSSDN